MAITTNNIQAPTNLTDMIGQNDILDQTIINLQQQQAQQQAVSMASNSERPKEFYLSTPELLKRIQLMEQLGARQAYLDNNRGELAKAAQGTAIESESQNILSELDNSSLNSGQKATLMQAYAKGRSEASASLNGSQGIDPIGLFFRNLAGGAATATMDMFAVPGTDNSAISDVHKDIQDWVYQGYTRAEREQAKHSAGLQALSKEIYNQNLLDVGADYANQVESEKDIFGSWTTTDWAANLGQGAGSLVPLIITSAASAGIGGAAFGATRAGLAGMTAVQRATAIKNARLLQTALGTAAETAMISGANRQSVYDSIMRTPVSELAHGSPAYNEMFNYYKQQGYSEFEASNLAKEAVAKSGANFAWLISAPAASIYRGFGAIGNKLSEVALANKFAKTLEKGKTASNSTTVSTLGAIGKGVTKLTGKALLLGAKVARPGIEEASQEAFEQILANAAEKSVNSNVSMSKDVAQSAILGGIIGAGHNNLAALQQKTFNAIRALRGSPEVDPSKNSSQTQSQSEKEAADILQGLSASGSTTQTTPATTSNTTSETASTAPAQAPVRPSESNLVNKAIQSTAKSKETSKASPKITESNFQENMDKAIYDGKLKTSPLGRALQAASDDTLGISFNEESVSDDEAAFLDIFGIEADNEESAITSPSTGIKTFISDAQSVNDDYIAQTIDNNVKSENITLDELADVRAQIHSLRQLSNLKAARQDIPTGITFSNAAEDVINNLSDEDLTNLNEQLDRIENIIANYQTANGVDPNNQVRQSPVEEENTTTPEPEEEIEQEVKSEPEVNTQANTVQNTNPIQASALQTGTANNSNNTDSVVPNTTNAVQAEPTSASNVNPNSSEQQATVANTETTNVTPPKAETSVNNNNNNNNNNISRAKEETQVSKPESPVVNTESTVTKPEQKEKEKENKATDEVTNDTNNTNQDSQKTSSNPEPLNDSIDTESKEESKKVAEEESKKETKEVAEAKNNTETEVKEEDTTPETDTETEEGQDATDTIESNTDVNPTAQESAEASDTENDSKETTVNAKNKVEPKTKEQTDANKVKTEVAETTDKTKNVNKPEAQAATTTTNNTTSISDLQGAQPVNKAPSKNSKKKKNSSDSKPTDLQDVNKIAKQNNNIQVKHNIFRVALRGAQTARRTLGSLVNEIRNRLQLPHPVVPTKSTSEDGLIHLTLDEFRTLANSGNVININKNARKTLENLLKEAEESKEPLTKKDLDKIPGLDEFAKESLLNAKGKESNLIPIGRDKIFKLLAQNNGKLQIVAPKKNEKVITLILLDTETTNLIERSDDTVSMPEITNLGMVKVTYSVDRNTLLSIDGIYDKYNEPTREVAAGAVNTTGLTKSMLKGYKIDFKEVRDFMGDLNSSILIAYNAKFDRAILESSFARNLEPELARETINNATYADAYQQVFWSRNSDTDKTDSKLTTVVGELGYSYPAHGALYDVLGMLQLGINQPINFNTLLRNSVNPTIEFIVKDSSELKRDLLVNDLGFIKIKQNGKEVYSLSVSGLDSAAKVEKLLTSSQYGLEPKKDYYVYTTTSKENNVYIYARDLLKRNNPVISAMLSENSIDSTDLQNKLNTEVAFDGKSLREAVVDEYETRIRNKTSSKKKSEKISTNYSEFDSSTAQTLEERDAAITRRVSEKFIGYIRKTFRVFSNTFFNSRRVIDKYNQAFKTVLENLMDKEGNLKYDLSTPLSQIFNQSFLSGLIAYTNKVVNNSSEEITLGQFLARLQDKVNKYLLEDKTLYELLDRVDENGNIPVSALLDTTFLPIIASRGILEQVINEVVINTDVINQIVDSWSKYEATYNELVKETESRNSSTTEPPMTVEEFIERLSFINELPPSVRSIFESRLNRARAYATTKLAAEIGKANRQSKKYKTKKGTFEKPVIISVEGINADLDHITNKELRDRLFEEYSKIYTDEAIQESLDEIRELDGWDDVPTRSTNLKDNLKIMLESLLHFKTYTSTIHKLITKIVDLLPTSTNDTLDIINNSPYSVDTTETNVVNAGGNINNAPITRANIFSNAFLQKIFRRRNGNLKPVVSIIQNGFDLEENALATRSTEDTPAANREIAKWKGLGIRVEAIINAVSRGIIATLPNVLSNSITLITENGKETMTVEEALNKYPSMVYSYNQGEYSFLSLLTQTANGFEFTPYALERLSAAGLLALHEIRKRMKEVSDAITYDEGDLLRGASNLTIERIRTGLDPNIRGVSEIEVLERITHALERVFNITPTTNNVTAAQSFLSGAATFVVSAMNNGVLTTQLTDGSVKSASKPFFRIKRVDISYIDETTSEYKTQAVNYYCPTLENTSRETTVGSRTLSVPKLVGSHDNTIYNILGENPEENDSYTLKPVRTPDYIRNTNINLTPAQKATQEHMAKQALYVDTDFANIFIEFYEQFNNQEELPLSDAESKYLPYRVRAAHDSRRDLSARIADTLSSIIALISSVEPDPKKRINVPVYSNAQMTKVNRIQINAPTNPVANPELRTILSPAGNRVLNLNDPKVMEGFKLALAQSFDISTDGLPFSEVYTQLDTILAALDEVIANPEYAPAITKLLKGASLQEVVSTEIKTKNYTKVPFFKILWDMTVDYNGETFQFNTWQAITGILTYFKYVVAKQNGTLNKFQTTLTYQIDGTTNGTYNALTNLGHSPLNESKTASFDAVGFFTGLFKTKNEHKSSGGKDIYTLATEGMAEKINEELNKIPDPDVRAATFTLLQVFYEDQYTFADIQTAEGRQSVVEKVSRNLAKTPTIGVSYASSKNGILETALKEAEKLIIQKLSNVSVNIMELSEALKAKTPAEIDATVKSIKDIFTLAVIKDVYAYARTNTLTAEESKERDTLINFFAAMYTNGGAQAFFNELENTSGYSSNTEQAFLAELGKRTPIDAKDTTGISARNKAIRAVALLFNFSSVVGSKQSAVSVFENPIPAVQLLLNEPLTVDYSVGGKKSATAFVNSAETYATSFRGILDRFVLCRSVQQDFERFAAYRKEDNNLSNFNSFEVLPYSQKFKYKLMVTINDFNIQPLYDSIIETVGADVQQSFKAAQMLGRLRYALSNEVLPNIARRLSDYKARNTPGVTLYIRYYDEKLERVVEKPYDGENLTEGDTLIYKHPILGNLDYTQEFYNEMANGREPRELEAMLEAEIKSNGTGDLKQELKDIRSMIKAFRGFMLMNNGSIPVMLSNLGSDENTQVVKFQSAGTTSAPVYYRDSTGTIILRKSPETNEPTFNNVHLFSAFQQQRLTNPHNGTPANLNLAIGDGGMTQNINIALESMRGSGFDYLNIYDCLVVSPEAVYEASRLANLAAVTNLFKQNPFTDIKAELDNMINAFNIALTYPEKYLGASMSVEDLNNYKISLVRDLIKIMISGKDYLSNTYFNKSTIEAINNSKSISEKSEILMDNIIGFRNYIAELEIRHKAFIEGIRSIPITVGQMAGVDAEGIITIGGDSDYVSNIALDLNDIDSKHNYMLSIQAAVYSSLRDQAEKDGTFLPTNNQKKLQLPDAQNELLQIAVINAQNGVEVANKHSTNKPLTLKDTSDFSTAMKNSVTGTVKEIFKPNNNKSSLYTKLSNAIINGIEFFMDVFSASNTSTESSLESKLRNTLNRVLTNNNVSFRIFKTRDEMLTYFKQFPNNYANAISALEARGKDIVAFFNPSTNEIIWDSESEKTWSAGDDAKFSKIIAHEVIHSITTQNLYRVTHDSNFRNYALAGNLKNLRGSDEYLEQLLDYWAMYNGSKSFKELMSNSEISSDDLFNNISEFIADTLLGDIDFNQLTNQVEQVTVTTSYWNNALRILGFKPKYTPKSKKKKKSEETISKGIREALTVTALAYTIKANPKMNTVVNANILAYSNSDHTRDTAQTLIEDLQYRNKHNNPAKKYASVAVDQLQELYYEMQNTDLELSEDQLHALLEYSAIISYKQFENPQGNLVLNDLTNQAYTILEKEFPKVYTTIRDFTNSGKRLRINHPDTFASDKALEVTPQAIVASLSLISPQIKNAVKDVVLQAPKKGDTKSTFDNLSIYAGNYIMKALIPKNLNSDLENVIQEVVSTNNYTNSKSFLDYTGNVMQAIERNLSGFAADILKHTFLKPYIETSENIKFVSKNTPILQDTPMTFEPATNGRSLNHSDVRYLQDKALNLAMRISTGSSYLDDILKGLAKDIVGRTPSTQRILSKVKQAKRIQGDRMRLRINMPKYIKDLFKVSKNSNGLTKEDDQALFDVISKIDVSSFESTNEVAKYINMTPEAIKKEYSSILEDVNKYYFNNLEALKVATGKLAVFLVKGIALSGLKRNALQIALSIGKNYSNNPNALIQKPIDIEAIKKIDKAVSLMCLHAISTSNPESLRSVRELLHTNESATKSVIQITNNILEKNKENLYAFMEEYLKDSKVVSRNVGYALYNYTKGYLGTEAKSDFQIYADKDNEDTRKNLAKYGWKYYSPVNNVPGYAFYTRDFNDKAVFNQGGIQIINRASLGARIDDPSTSLGIGFSGNTKLVEYYFSNAKKEQSLNALPIYNTKGAVIGLEFVPPLELLEKQKRTNTISEVLSIALGRQLETTYATQFNREIINMLQNAYRNASPNEKKNYVNVFDIKDNVIKDAINEIPTNVKAYIYESYNPKSRKHYKNLKETPPTLYVRKDLVEDIIGERSFSISELYSGVSSHTTTSKLFNLFVNIGVRPIFRDTTYEFLIKSEKAMQNIVLAAKSMIVVRSCIVPVANALANAFQLYCEGVPIAYMKKKIPEKVREIETYVRFQNRLLQLTIDEQAYNIDSYTRKNIQFEKTRIENTIKKMSIYPLIQAGEFSSVVNIGESIEDGLLYSGQLDKFLTKLSSFVPNGVPRHIAENLLLTPNSPLYQGILKAVQYTDLVSKAVMYDHLTKEKLYYREEALRRVSDAFIDYDRKGSRSRMYAESIGLLWFWNFKLRILKSAIALIHNRPLLALFIMSNPLSMGIGNPITDNIIAQLFNGTLAYSVGPGMAASGLMMHPAATLVNGLL